MRKLAMILMVAVILMAGSTADAKKWFFGIGTGLSGTNLEGNIGMTVPEIGPIYPEVELDPEEFQDLVSTAIGGGGYATDGSWMFTVSGGYFKLEGDGSGTTDEGSPLQANIDFEITLFEAHLGYTVYRSESKKFSFQPYTGVRYTGHEITSDLTVGEELSTRVRDNDWADFLIGASIGVVFSPKWSWSVSGDGGFGGSEGTGLVKTSITFRPWKHWTFSPNASFMTTDYENGNRGDEEWYKYDVEDTKVGLSFLYHF
jgi:hypothetical protein